MNKGRSIFQQSFFTELGREVPSVLCIRMMLEGIVVLEQRNGQTNFNQKAKRDEPDDKPIEVQHHRSKEDIQKVKQGNYKGGEEV